MINRKILRWAAGIVSVFSLAMVGGVVIAAPSAHAEDAQQTVQERRDAAQTRLADAKLKACQNREKAINNIMARIADRGQKQLDLFSKIADRTEKFYTDKGKTLSNYDALVADVAAKKASAQTKVDTIKSTSTTFACDGTDPKGVLQSFKDALKSEISALKDYRTSIKNLIVGVKSVQSTESAEGGQQ
jgi:iron-sulfur cluster repair protein YtfE (RIC family)